MNSLWVGVGTVELLETDLLSNSRVGELPPKGNVAKLLSQQQGLSRIF